MRVCAVMVVLLHMAYSASAGMLVGECEAIEWLNSGGLSPTAQLQVRAIILGYFDLVLLCLRVRGGCSVAFVLQRQ